jgi:hypothetical protein
MAAHFDRWKRTTDIATTAVVIIAPAGARTAAAASR